MRRKRVKCGLIETTETVVAGEPAGGPHLGEEGNSETKRSRIPSDGARRWTECVRSCTTKTSDLTDEHYPAATPIRKEATMPGTLLHDDAQLLERGPAWNDDSILSSLGRLVHPKPVGRT